MNIKSLRRRGFEAVTALLLMTSLATVHAQLSFTTNNGAITITGYTGPGGVIVIPAVTNGYPVTGIAQQAFYGRTNLASVIIPGSVTNIGDYAFENCTGLTSAYFNGNAPFDGGTVFSGDSVTVYYQSGSTGWNTAFGGAPAVEETAPGQFIYQTNENSITILAYAGSGGSVIVPDAINGYPVTSIAPYAFNGVNVTSVTIASGVTNIGEGAFFQTFTMTNVVIPDSVTAIGFLAFENCFALASVNLPNSLVSIGEEAFNSCTSLKNFAIPNNVTSIGEGAIGGCYGLTNISASAANPDFNSLSGVLFDKDRDTLLQYPASLTNILYIIPNGVTNIVADAFEHCTGLASVTIPDSLASIGANAFADCASLNSVNIPNSLTSIGDYAFSGCVKLTGITLPDSVTSIGDYAFEDCGSLTNVAIPGSVTSIGEWAFAGCALKSVTIQSGTSSIGDDAFEGCNLSSITISGSVASIGESAFEYCGSLKTVYFQGNAPAVGTNVFYGDPTTIYYLPGTSGWSSLGLPTAVWFQSQPTILFLEPPSLKKTHPIGFTISWATNASVTIQACTNISNPTWVPQATNLLNDGTNYFTDPSWENYPSRYYRVTGP